MRWRLVLVALVAVLMAEGCATPAPTKPTPRAILTRAADEMDKINTLHFSLEQQNGSLQVVSGVRIADAEGDVQRPNGLKMKFTQLLGGGVSAEAQQIALGAERFLTNPLTGVWRRSALPSLGPRLLDNDRGASNLLRKIADPQNLGNEAVDGLQTFHLMGSVPTDAFADMTGSQPTTGIVTGEVWVSASDFLVHQIRLEGPIDTDDTDATIRILTFSSFNQTVTIERPTN